MRQLAWGIAHLSEVVQVPLVVLAGPVPWEVGRLLVGNRLNADLELLQRWSVACQHAIVVADMPCARPARRNWEAPWWSVVLQKSSRRGAGSHARNFLIAIGASTTPSTDARANCNHGRVHYSMTILDEPHHRHARPLHSTRPLRPHTGTASETFPPCPSPSRVWPATPRSECA